jgi:glycolate oxidase
MPTLAHDYSVVIDDLTAALGAAVVTAPDTLDEMRTDRSGHVSPTAPIATVYPHSVADVQAVMRIASAHGIPVVTRGAGTGLAGGALASQGEIVLSTSAMDRVLEINVPDELAVVEPGILNAELNRRLLPHGLWFAPDPASREISTVGGNIATNAGGLLCAKYGVTRDSVLGLSVVLADGRLIETGHRTSKGVTGLDLTSLMVGSEGVLGVIVGATVRARRLTPGPIFTVSAYFRSVREAADACAAVTADGIRPSIMELMDGACLAAVGSYLGIKTQGGAYVVAQTDGAAAEGEARELARVLAENGGTVGTATTATEAESMLAIRRAMHPALVATGTVLIEDVAVPRSSLPAMFDAITEVEARFGITIPTAAHAGDGNLHPNFVFAGAEVPDHIWAAADMLFQTAISLGGTLTGEHGVGILKRRWLRGELGDDQFDLQAGIKTLFDPQGLLNPGKVF